MSAEVLVEQRGSALWLTINREARRNALNENVLETLRSAVIQAEDQPEIRSLVLTGAGEKAFCAGADLASGAKVFGAKYNEPTTDFGRLARAVARSRLPLIGRVNGACVAGGMSLLGLCDIAIASENAKFGLPETGVGVFPLQVYVHYRHLMAPRHFAELAFTGEYIDAHRAWQIGLVNRTVPVPELDAEVVRYTDLIAAKSGVAIKRGRQAMVAMQSMSFDEAMSFAESQIMIAALTDDAAEGIQAFVDKRKPNFG